MKQNIDIKTKVASPLPHLHSSWENYSVERPIVIREIANALLLITPRFVGRQGGGHKDFNQGLGRDGPPGRARSPGTLANQFPDHPPDKDSPLPPDTFLSGQAVPPQGESLANRFSDHPPDIGRLSLPETVEGVVPELVEGNYYNETRKTKPYSPQPPPVGDPFPLSFRREGRRPGTGCQGELSSEFLNNKQMNINILKQKTNFNFLQTFKFFIMKKQILIIAVFLMAAFASVTNSYGQATALKPSPGTPYTYEVATSGLTITGTETYLWYVTEGTNLLTGAHTAATTYFAVGTGTGESIYDNTVGGTDKINLTWNSASVGKTFYLVVVYTAQTTNENATTTTCTVQNMKSYEIVPMNTLELTVTLAKVDGSDNTDFPQICAPDVFSATVTAGTSVNYNYGTMTFYYNIKASGMDGKWQPKVELNALLGNSQAYTDVSWSTNPSGTWTSMTGFSAGGTAQSLSVADEDASVTGENFLVRVVINNAGYETLTPHAIELRADGFVTGSSPLLSDIVGGGTYTQALPFEKKANYTVTPRPTIGNVPGADGATFFNKVP